jgi:hypothetical protein
MDDEFRVWPYLFLSIIVKDYRTEQISGHYQGTQDRTVESETQAGRHVEVKNVGFFGKYDFMV